MNAVISFFALGEPKGQPRQRHRLVKTRDGREFVHGFDPGDADDWKASIRRAAAPYVTGEPLDLHCPCRVDITFLFPRPDGHFGTGKNAGKLKASAPVVHKAKPDRDNCDKAVLDTLQEMGFFRNDSSVSIGLLAKLYCPPGAHMGAFIAIYQVDEDALRRHLTQFFRTEQPAMAEQVSLAFEAAAIQ